eukprot:COSAG06_NODE_64431_length_259_cov_1.018750_1_plen_48_part_10
MCGVVLPACHAIRPDIKGKIPALFFSLTQQTKDRHGTRTLTQWWITSR